MKSTPSLDLAHQKKQEPLGRWSSSSIITPRMRGQLVHGPGGGATQAVTQFVNSNLTLRQGPVIFSMGGRGVQGGDMKLA